MKYPSLVKETPQSEAIPGQEARMQKNDAGGFGYKINDLSFLNRFLILGTENGTYYVDPGKHTRRALTPILNLIRVNPLQVVERLTEISVAGRAIKNDPAIFVLALVIKHSEIDGRKAAYEAIPKVCRTLDHLASLATALKSLDKGWGRGLKRAVANWFLSKTPDKLVYQVSKYQQRQGWSNGDFLRLSHPKTTDPILNSIFQWILGKENVEDLPEYLKVVDSIRNSKKDDLPNVISAIQKYSIPRECIPTELLQCKEIWDALVVDMPMTATIRNLGKMTEIGTLTNVSNEKNLVVQKLKSPEMVRKSKLHPFNILTTMKLYESGRSDKGKLTWTPVPQITSALETAFYNSFDNIEPIGQNFFIGLDVSGSMTCRLNNNISAAEAGAALVMSIIRREPNWWVYGFSDKFVDLGFTETMDLPSVLNKTRGMTFGSTDCALPMIHATKNKLDVDTFVVITDNETWYGSVHPSQALKEYRRVMNKPNAKLLVLALSAIDTSIADPKDLGMLDIVGLDPSIPTIMNQFCKGF